VTLLVTGGAGYVGSHFVRAAVDAGRRVVVLDDLSGGRPAPLPRGVELIPGDIGSAALIRRLAADLGITGVVHFAGKIQVGESVQHPDLYFDVNLVRTLSLLGVVRELGVRVFLFSSTAAVYGTPETVPIPETARLEPINPYGASKLGIEYALRAWGDAYGLRWAALRYFNAAGAHPDGTLREAHEPESHLIPLVVDAALGRREPITVFGDAYPTPDGTCIRDYIHVCDLAAAHLAALEALEQGRPVGALNLGTGQGHSVRAVLDATAEVLGRPVPHRVGAPRAGDPPALVAAPGQAAATLAWSARCSDLRTVIEDTVRSRR
jgi:UDP-glucose 4-epimerase